MTESLGRSGRRDQLTSIRPLASPWRIEEHRAVTTVNNEDPQTPQASSNAATVAGIAAMVVGGVGVIIAAIGDFGSDSGALGAARRNHPNWLIAAASAAAAGLLCGGLYTIFKKAFGEDPKTRWTGWVPLVILCVGVGFIAGGVGVGAYATANRQPGRPSIEVTRVDASTINVQITAEGLGSNDWFEADVVGYPEDTTTTSGPSNGNRGCPRKGTATSEDKCFQPVVVDVPLAAARFSPGQDGKLDWKQLIDVDTFSHGGTTGLTIARVQVRVAHKALFGLGHPPGDCTHGEVTCLALRLPPTVASSGSTAAD
jgi:hypothetical protein